MKKYDIIIIGTGAGGGTLAYQLAQTGKNILILERGEYLPKEVENWNPREVYTNGRYRPQEKWYDKDGKSFAPFTHYCVGGNTKMYGAALLRLRESDFTEVEHFDGASPAWPLSYEDFEPYYTQAEKLYHVHGTRGVDPTEPRASQPFPYPAMRPEADMKIMYEQLQELGYRPAPIPLGIRLPVDGRKPSEKLVPTLFDGYPDPTGAKADAHVIGIKPAVAKDHVTLLTGMHVKRLETDTSGKVITKVVAEKDGEEHIFSADIVAVSCGAINSAALLLRSTSEQHPNGLANSSGLVGRNLMLHNNGTVVAVTEKEINAPFQKSFLLSEYYHNAPDSEFPLGTIQQMGKTDPDTLRGELEDIFGKGAELDLDYYARHTVDFFITAEDLPRHENQVALLSDGSIQLIYTPTNLEAYNRLKAKLETAMQALGAQYGYGDKIQFVGFKLGISGVSHQLGTCRFGDDPNTSVLDLNCKAHDLDNLYVVDTSFFPSAGAVNPSLTAMANALRVGEHLIRRMGWSVAKMEMAEMAN